MTISLFFAKVGNCVKNFSFVVVGVGVFSSCSLEYIILTCVAKICFKIGNSISRLGSARRYSTHSWLLDAEIAASKKAHLIDSPYALRTKIPFNGLSNFMLLQYMKAPKANKNGLHVTKKWTTLLHCINDSAKQFCRELWFDVQKIHGNAEKWLANFFTATFFLAHYNWASGIVLSS